MSVMVAWVFCACCSGARERRQQYRYEVVYRREESLYSGPDYLESLPGGGRSSLSKTPPERRQLQQQQQPQQQHNQQQQQQLYKEYSREESGAFFFPSQRGDQQQQQPRFALPLPTPVGSESLSRQNRVNHFLTSLNRPQLQQHRPSNSRGAPLPAPRSGGWKSATYLGNQGPGPGRPKSQHHQSPERCSRTLLQQARSAPLLLALPPTADESPAEVGHSRDQSQSSRDLSRDTSRDHSLASSANSSRPLLPLSHGRSPYNHIRPSIAPIRPPPPPPPPLPGPPGYPTAVGALHRAPPPPPPGCVTRDLRQYLSTRFPKGGVDHDLQNTIRDNVYLRTVPVTTRAPRPGEVNGVDYTFLAHEEFLALQRSGSLLEAGIFEGNHYGTPKPPAQGGEVGKGSSSQLLGAHPSSEGKRRRNRSNVEAMAANTIDSPPQQETFGGPVPYQPPPEGERVSSSSPAVELGPLPPNWEKAFTENGEPYFIDHVAGTSSWLDPRLARVQKRSAEECGENELPFGWERIDDPQYGTYYIDHVNRKTQYENPVLMAKRQLGDSSQGVSMEEGSSSSYPRPKKQMESEGSLPKLATENGHAYHPTPKRSYSFLPCLNCLPCSASEVKDSPVGSSQRMNKFPLTTAGEKASPSLQGEELKKIPLHQISIGSRWGWEPCGPRVEFSGFHPEELVLDRRGGGVGSRSRPYSPNQFLLAPIRESTPRDFISSSPKLNKDVSSEENSSLPIAVPPYGCVSSSLGATIRLSHWRRYPPRDRGPSPLPSLSFSSLCWPEEDPVVGRLPWKGRSAFTRNPAELKGEFLRTALIKSSRGLGFTIVGGDDNEEEFLQIKSVVPNGPAWQDGKLRTGDVLVYVNDTCVLGYTHADVVNMFQNIDPGRTVYLEVCRGYPLPFDPNDPNTEIVTTVAVTSADTRSSKSGFGDDFEGHRSRNNSNESMNTAKSMPDLTNTERVQVPRPGSADLLNSENFEMSPQVLDFYPTLSKPEYLTIPIVKGNMGFGFTIADSAYGQKVKKILDRSRCKNLCEGDILVDINNINVKGMSHTEVVQVLKDCTQGHEAIVMVQRGGLSSPSKSRGGGRNKESSSPKKAPSSSGVSNSTGSGLYRSKTPTADMYSSQPKEVIPNRPKTPLVDTRNRSKTPTTYSERDNCEIDGIQDMPKHFSGTNPPYPGAFSYIGSHNMDPADHKVNNLSSQLGHASLNGHSFDQDSGNGNYNHSYPPRDIYNQNGYPLSSHSFEYGKDSFNKPILNHSDQHPHYSYYSSNNSNVYNENNPHTNLPNIDQSNSYGYIPYQKEGYDIPRQDSGYSSQAQVPPSRNPYPPYYGHNSSVGYSGPPDAYFGPNDVASRRKESTSFELEHPAPLPMARFPTIAAGGISRHGPGGPNNMEGPNNYHDFSVTLRRQENGFGFRIVGGTEEGSQVSIGHIVPGGAADQDGTVMSGDEIICVDGEVVIGSSHRRVVQLMAAAGNQGRVTMTLRRPSTVPPLLSSSDVHNRSMEVQYPYDVTVTRRENEGFGFVIISSVAKSGSTIGRIIEGSPAERCGKLHIGDRILRVNGIDIKSLHHGSIVNLIKESGYTVTLTIGPPRDDASSTTSNSQRAESEAGDMEGELHHVELHRSSRGFGFSIRGGKEFHNMPLFVLRIADNGPAAEDGKLKVGDQLIEINHVSTKSMTHAEAIELIKQCGSTVTLLVRRGGKIPPHIDPLSPVNPNNLGSPVGPPPPGTHIRSTATLPSGSPSNPNYGSPQNMAPMGHYGYSPATGNMPPTSSYPSNYTHSGSGRGPPQPMHSSPASQYPLPLNPHTANGPLGQSSPRVVSGPGDSYYWNRPG